MWLITPTRACWEIAETSLCWSRKF
jgi:hypothetical protein